MFEPELPQMPEGEAQELIAQLKSLKRVSAPVDFAAQLNQRIAADTPDVSPLKIVETSPSTLRRTRFFPYQRTVFSLAAAALVTIVLLNVLPSTTYPPAVVHQNAEPPNLTYKPVVPPAETQMQMTAAPGSIVEPPVASKSVPNKEHIASNATPRRTVEENQTKNVVQQQFPQELIKSQRGLSTPLVGGSLSTVSKGSGASAEENVFSGAFGQGIAMQQLSVPQVAGAFPSTGVPLATRKADSIHIRDSIRNAKKLHQLH